MNKVDNFIEIVLLSIVNFLVTRKHRNITLTVTDRNPASICRPSETIEWTVAFRYLLSDNRNFSVRINVPNVNETFSIA